MATQHDDNEDPENKIPWLDVIEQQQFLIPAGGGLVLVALALLFGSPYKWVLLFSYFFIALPAIAVYTRHYMPPDEPAEAALPKHPEPEAGARIRVTFEHLKGSKNIDEEHLTAALQQYKQLEGVRQTIRKYLLTKKSENEDFDEESRTRGLAASERVYQGVLKNLHACSILFAKLDAIDFTALVKTLQTVRGGREHDDATELAVKREKMISQLLDRLKSGESLLSKYKNAAAPGLKPEVRMKQLRDLVDKTSRQDVRS